MEISLKEKRRSTARAKTGCQTCRIRRIKCDETRPACQKCIRSDRQCDGYGQLHNIQQSVSARIDQSLTGPTLHLTIATSYEIPFSIPGSQRDRQLFHLYCVKSAAELAGGLGPELWYDHILQYSQHYAVVRQAIIAFSSAHFHYLRYGHASEVDSFEHIRFYNRALRSFQKYLASTANPDPPVILLCNVLFFCYENATGNSEAALVHLESGLQILNARLAPQVQPTRSCSGLKSEVSARILHLFARLDGQASLYENERIPRLDLEDIVKRAEHQFSYAGPFDTITSAQCKLDILVNRLGRFLGHYSSYQDTPAEDLPVKLIQQKFKLQIDFTSWRTGITNFVENLKSRTLQHIFYSGKLDPTCTEQEKSTAIQIHVMILHHRMYSLYLHSNLPFVQETFSKSPNPELEEILFLCNFIADSLHLYQQPSTSPSERVQSCKLSSELGILVPLFLVAAKSGDASLRSRSIHALKSLRGYREGLHGADMLYQIVEGMQQRNSNVDNQSTEIFHNRNESHPLNSEASQSTLSEPVMKSVESQCHWTNKKTLEYRARDMISKASKLNELARLLQE